MAKTRIVHTGIWDEDWFFQFSERAQRAYMFFVTNKNTEISGFYRMGMHELKLYFKLDEDKIRKTLKELEPKIYYIDDWVVIPNYPKYQNVANNVKVQISIEKYMKKIPKHILNYKSEIINHKSQIINHKSETIDSLPIAYKEKAKPSKKPKESIDVNKLWTDCISEYLSKYAPSLITEFTDYWRQKNKGGTRELWQTKKIFDFGRRLSTWKRNNEKFQWEKEQNRNKPPEPTAPSRERGSGGLERLTFNK